MPDPGAYLLEKDRIVDVINRLFIATDRRDWPGVRQCFSDSVLFDMTSMAGGKPESLTPRQITDGWEQGLRDLEAIHHQAGNYLATVKEREADASCYGIALHRLPARDGGGTRRFVGSYDFHLVNEGGGWQIDRFRFNLKFIDGG